MNTLKQSILGLIFTLLASLSHAQLVDKTIVIVSDEVITQNEWDQEFDRIRLDFQQRGKQLPDNIAIRKQVLEKLIMRSILLQKAKQQNIVIAERHIQGALKKVAASNKLTLPQFQKAIIKQGLSYSSFYERIKNELTIQQLQSRESNRLVNVSEQEVQAALTLAGLSDNKEYLTAHILLPVPEAATPKQVTKQLNKINELKQQLSEGADFNTLAQKYSSGENALEGGELGWRKQHELPSLFANIIQDLGVGNYSNAIRSPSGFHILHLIEQRDANQITIEQKKTRHILIKLDALQDDEEIIANLNSIRDRILQGEDFATLAKANSVDHVSASQGGDLGWVTQGQMVPAFEDKMNSIKINDISKPFKSQFGWHILQVTAERTIKSTDNRKEKTIKNQLIKRKRAEALELWQKRLRDQTYVKFI